MKIKSQRDDFVVEEIAEVPLGGGKHAAYRLEKSGVGTPEAISQIVAAWGLSRQAISHAGLKDRHAVTTQTISIANGPRENLEVDKFSLTYLGQTLKAVDAQHLVANQFTITVRSLEAAAASKMLALINDSKLCIPNYFDKQRFGSIGVSGEMVAVPWCKGDYERAVYLAMAEHNPNDGAMEMEQRAIVRDHWGDWQACKDRLERSNRRSVVTYLVDHPQGFKKAAALISRDMRSLYVSAFQSRIWNEVVARWIASEVPDDHSAKLETAGGTLVFPRELPADLLERMQTLAVPLPSSRPTKWPDGFKQRLADVLEAHELPVHKLRFSHPRDVFFSRKFRPVLLTYQPQSAEVAPDEMSQSAEMSSSAEDAPEKQKLVMRFRLAPGQYATMLLKALEVLSA